MTTNKRNHGTVLITGASSGIGRELALEFGARAETLILAARKMDRLEQLREELLGRYPGLKVIVLAADLSDDHEAERLLALQQTPSSTVECRAQSTAGTRLTVSLARSSRSTAAK